MSSEKFFEDYSIGESRKTPGRTITEADVVLHAGQTGDYYPHHTDEAWCQSQPLGHRIAHGTLSFAIAAGLKSREINFRSMTYGYERVRFPHPVYFGDTVHVVTTITDKRPHPKKAGFGIVTEHTELRNQRDEVVLACDHLHFVECRNA